MKTLTSEEYWRKVLNNLENKDERWPDLSTQNWRKLVKQYFDLINRHRPWWHLFPIRSTQFTNIGGSLTLSCYWLRQDGDFNLEMMLGEYTSIEGADKVLDEIGRAESFDWLRERLK
jgi:hypothetical protein